MPLQLFKLDERLEPSGPTFQRIVDEAKRKIKDYCPEWTDHNVSDPGVALIELFAWMTETLLYRVNQVPDRMLVKFLELIGMRLEPPKAARVPVTFYLTAPQSADVRIEAGTEVATLRTETSEPITFTTSADLIIHPPLIIRERAYSSSIQRSDQPWVVHNLPGLLIGQPIKLFPEPPTPGDCFYLPLEQDHSQHVLALVLSCTKAGPDALKRDNPPRVWEVSDADHSWAPCVIESDSTYGFSQANGEIVLRLPTMAPAEYQGQRAYWLRCRYTEPVLNTTGRYKESPEITSLRIEARGGTVIATHDAVIEHELLGVSDGTPGQQFKLRHTPLLARDPAHDYLVVVSPDGVEERWEEVSDFGHSHDDRHYTLDAISGTLTLGPTLLQPDGTVYLLGQKPAKGSRLVFRRYRYGGGQAGNVTMGALCVLKSSDSRIRRVTNLETAQDGCEAQSLDDAVLRDVPKYLRSRERAVTASDYEYLACRVVGVARACCLAPGRQPAAPGAPGMGEVVVAVLPKPASETDPGRGMVDPAWLTLAGPLQAAVEDALNQRRLLSTTLAVRQPTYVEVSIMARLRVARENQASLLGEVQRRAEAILYRYLNPYTGGPRGDGWPFGRHLQRREIETLLERTIPDVERVEEVRMHARVFSGAAITQSSTLTLPADGLLCSGPHRVEVLFDG